MRNKEVLHVIAAVSNTRRFRSRYALYDKFRDHVHRSQDVARLTTVELVFGDRAQYVTAAHENFRHVQVRSRHELWHKENLINIGIQHLPDDWKYVAWIDADVEFLDPRWAIETIQKLQHNQFVQMFETAIDLGPCGQSLKVHNSFVSQYLKGAEFKTGYSDWHPGFAWAARREAIDQVGGLIDVGILGSGDRHMACGLIGQAPQSYSAELTDDYKNAVLRWQTRAEDHVKRDIGYVNGTLLHAWHGKKRDRRYSDRWKILERNQFSPVTDLKRDWQGLWALEVETPRQMQLRDEIRAYFRARNEDSIDLA